MYSLSLGYGHLVRYLGKERVTAYVALEPNVLMHERLRKAVREAGVRRGGGDVPPHRPPCGGTSQVSAER